MLVHVDSKGWRFEMPEVGLTQVDTSFWTYSVFAIVFASVRLAKILVWLDCLVVQLRSDLNPVVVGAV